MIACSLAAQTKGPLKVGSSPRVFVEEFYAWYVPRALSDDTAAGWHNTLRSIHSDISPKLARLLEEDSAAQAKCKEIVGLDFDPFLYTQEPAEHFEVGGVTQAGEHYRADIYRVESGKRSEKPDVIAEFMRKGNRWFFVNFYYSGGADLLSVLKSRPPCSAPRVGEKK
jgi:hypothetical protein